MKKILLCMLALLMLCVCGLNLTVSETTQPDENEIEEITTDEYPAPPQISGFTPVEIMAKNEYCCYALKQNEKMLLPVTPFITDFVISKNKDTVSLFSEELEITAQEGREFISANGRYIYLPESFLFTENELYIPVDAFEKLFSVRPVSDKTDILEININDIQVLQGGEMYYEYYYSTDDIVWLSRIIFAEAENQPLAGKIAVGNVVLNRVASELYPDTVFKVVFQYQNSSQFTPKENERLFYEPDEDSLIAAYLCLEGYNNVDDCMFFLNSAIAQSNWIVMQREYVTTIADHDFYR